MLENTDRGTSAQDIIKAAQHTYEIVKMLGEGGMGTVYLVRSPSQKEPVALKFLSQSMMNDTRIAGFKREFSLLTEIHHPHICRVYDFGYSTSHEQYFFTAECVEGVDLFRGLLQAPLEEVETVFAQILHALDFIHSVGLIHFDIKGDNILLSRQGGKPHAKVVDFGIANPANQPLTEIAGTLYYMAPELFVRGAHIDRRVDLYAMGVVCYRVLTGIYPYEVQSVLEAKDWHLDHKIDFEPLKERGIPDYIVKMLQRLLEPDQEKRFLTARAVIEHLNLHSGTNFDQLLSIHPANQVDGPLVGRDSQLATIENAIERVVQFMSSDATIDQEEHPQSYLLAGERGHGKSRVLKDIKNGAQLKDCATWLVDAQTAGRDLADFCAAFDITLGEDEHTADGASTALLDAATNRATCFLIDNFDRGAPSVQKTVLSLLGLLYSATLAHNAPPLIVVLSYTPADHKAPRVTGSPTLALGPLSQEECTAYVSQMIGDQPDTAEFVGAVWDFSQGVPFLMNEATRRYHQDEGDLPASIEELYTAQLGRLAKKDRALLECLAFAKGPLSAADLAALLDTVDTNALAALQQSGMVRFRDDREDYLPSTGALAQAVVQGMTKKRRAALATRFIAWMTTDADYAASDVADYVPYSTNREEAVTILRKAATEAEQRGEGELAVQHLGDCADLLDALKNKKTDYYTVQRKRATLLLYQGKYQACEELLHQIAAKAGTPAVEDLKLLGLAKRAQRKPKEAGVFYDKALTLLPEDTSDPIYLFILNERAQALLEEGAVQQAIELYEKSHQWTKTLPKKKRVKVTNNNMGIAYARLGKFDEALKFYEEKLSLLGQEKRIAASVYGQIGVIYLHAGQTSKALNAFLESWNRSSTLGDSHNALALLDNIIALLQKQARYSEALTYAQRSFQLKAAGGADADLSRSLMTVATLHLNLGLPDLAARYLTQAMRLARKCRNHQLLGWIQITFGYLYKDLGRLMESLNAYEETIAIGEINEDDSLVSWGCYGAVDLLVDNGEIDEATAFNQQLHPLLTKEIDDEFRVRNALLAEKIKVVKQPKPPEDIGPKLLEIVAQCDEQGWLELHWEAEYLLGVFHEKRDEFDPGLQHIQNSYDIIKNISNGLAEEYQENYLRQLARARVRADLTSLLRLTGQLSTGQEIDQTQAPAPGVTMPGATMPSVAEDAPATQVSAPLDPEPNTAFVPGKPLADYEKEILLAALQHFAGDLEAMANSLQLSLDALEDKCALHGIDPGTSL